MDDVKKEHHDLLILDRGDRSSLYPLYKLVYDDKQVRIAPWHPLERSDQIEPLDHDWPCDGDRLKCLDWQVRLPSIVLTPFAGAHNLFSIGYRSRLVEALSECISDQGSRRDMVTVDPTMYIAHQLLPLFYGDAAL